MIGDKSLASNSSSTLPHLVGEEIAAAIQQNDGMILLVFKSGSGLVFGAPGTAADAKHPVFWTVGKNVTAQVLAERRAKIAELKAAIGEG